MPAFQLSLDKRLRANGLEGKLAWATLRDGGIDLTDDLGHTVRIALSDIVRIRIGFVETKRRTYHCRIWQDPIEDAIELIPTIQSWPQYRQEMIALVAQMAERSRLDRVETGSSKIDALIGPILISIPTIAALLVSIFVLTEEPWWGRAVVPIIPLILFFILAWMGKHRHWPRMIGSPNDVLVQLPP